jgi:hypothetical protein
MRLLIISGSYQNYQNGTAMTGRQCVEEGDNESVDVL